MLELLYPNDPGVQLTIQRVKAASPAEVERDAGQLREGIREMVWMVPSLSPAGLRALEQSLRERNLPSLHVIERLLSRDLRRILRTGKVQSAEDYDMLRTVVEDGGGTFITESDRERLAMLVARYEAGLDQGAQ